MRVEHVFATIGPDKCEDYVGFFNVAPRNYSPERYPIIADSILVSTLESNISSLCDKTFIPTLGDEVHVVPDCTLAVQDIRNNYKIKREFDGGVCNVFSPIRRNKGYAYLCKHFLVCQDAKYLVCYAVSRHEEKNLDDDMILRRMENLIPDELKELNWDRRTWNSIHITFLSVNEHYRNLLLKQASKPCIVYSQLPMNRNELTADLLFLAVSSGRKYTFYDKNAVQKHTINLSAIAQTNWKEYPGTMGIVFGSILKYFGVHEDMRTHPEKYAKQVRELLEYDHRNPSEFNGDKDFQMSKILLENMLQIGRGKFVTLQQLRNKLNEKGISESSFLRVYDTMIKITVKEK